MKNWKAATLFTCSCLITIPVLAVEQPKNTPATSAVQPQLLPKEDVQTSFDKKTFMEQMANPSEPHENNTGKSVDLSAAFDLLDKNHDGKIDSKELQTYSDNDISDDGDDANDSDINYDTSGSTNKKPQASSARPIGALNNTTQTQPDSKTGSAGIPPVNANQLLK